MEGVSGQVLSINTSRVRLLQQGHQTVATGILKQPVEGRLLVEGVNLEGDRQADLESHGGPTRALYAYAGEDYRWWSESLGRPLPPGKFGENLTLEGIDVSGALIGERWRVGNTLLQVTSPRVPCAKLAMVMEEPTFVRQFAQALRPGAYLAIVESGDVAAGDAVEVVSKPGHKLTLAEMARIYFFERERAAEMLVPELPKSWSDWAMAQGKHAS
jgi:MOSC domain-containing protein YiiM